MSMHYPSRRGKKNAPLGLLTVALIVALLVAGATPLGALTWPFWFAVPALGFLALMRRWGRSAALLAIPALLSLGMTFAFLPVALLGAHAFLYSWAAFLPMSLGLGLGAYGQMARKPGVEQTGDLLAKLGAGIVLLGALAVEGVRFMTNPGWVIGPLLVVMAVALGVALVSRRRGRRRPGRRAIYTQQPRQLPQREIDELEAELFGTREKEPARR